MLIMVPNRFDDGYGLSPEVVEQVAARGAELIVTVDNGISSHAGVDLAHALGIQVLVTDHHLPGETLPAAEAIINPNLVGCDFLSKSLAGVGVTFYLMLALRARLRASGWFEQRALAEPNLAELLDLVALGTVADVVPLDANNRILVHQGLSRIRAGKCRQESVHYWKSPTAMPVNWLPTISASPLAHGLMLPVASMTCLLGSHFFSLTISLRPER